MCVCTRVCMCFECVCVIEIAYEYPYVIYLIKRYKTKLKKVREN